MVVIRFQPVNWRDIYSVLGYFHAWYVMRRKPQYVHVEISCDGSRWLAMSANKGVYYSDEHCENCEYITYPHASATYVLNVFEIFLYRKIRFSRHMTCITFVATCIHLHTLEFRTADEFLESLSGLSELLD